MHGTSVFTALFITNAFRQNADHCLNKIARHAAEAYQKSTSRSEHYPNLVNNPAISVVAIDKDSDWLTANLDTVRVIRLI